MPKVTLTRDKHLLYFQKHGETKIVRYDLKKLEMQVQRDGTWKKVRNQYKYFQYCHIGDIETTDEHFLKLLEKSRRVNDTCTALSTFIVRMKNAIVYENYIREGIDASYSSSWSYRADYKTHLLHPLEDYDKNIIKFFKDTGFKIRPIFEDNFFDNPKTNTAIINSLQNEDRNPEEKKQAATAIFYSGYNDFKTLIKEHGYEPKALIAYIIDYLQPFENIEPGDALNILKDYYGMAKLIGRTVKKYPKYLRSMHDIITANHQAFKKHYDKQLFERAKRPELQHEGKTYSMIIPTEPKEIVAEGTSLNHCVGSYIDKIIEKRTYILFLRKNDELDEPLVTVEIIGTKIVHAKGSYNRRIEDSERTYLQQYAKEKKLQLAEAI